MTTYTGPKQFHSSNHKISALLRLPLLAAGVLAVGTLRAEPAPELFAQRCAMCHGKDGKAGTPMARKMGVKDLTASDLSPETVLTRVQEGYRTPSGAQKMPAFKEQLSSDDIPTLVDFVLSLRAQ